MGQWRGDEGTSGWFGKLKGRSLAAQLGGARPGLGRRAPRQRAMLLAQVGNCRREGGRPICIAPVPIEVAGVAAIDVHGCVE